MGSYDKTLGLLLVGVFFNTFLYGLAAYQFAVYYRTRFNDRTMIKYTMLFSFVLDTFHSGSLVYMIWYYFVTNLDGPAFMNEVILWPQTITPLCASLAAFITQIYLGFDIWRLTKSKILYGITVILAIPSLILGALTGIEASIIKPLSDFPLISSLSVSWMTTEVVVDLYNTTTLIILYSCMRTGFQKTDTILNRLIRGAVQTGLLASVFSIAVLVCVIPYAATELYAMFSIPLGRIYTNTLLDILLTREAIKAEIGDKHNEDLPVSMLTTRILIEHLGSSHPGWNSSSSRDAAPSKSI